MAVGNSKAIGTLVMNLKVDDAQFTRSLKQVERNLQANKKIWQATAEQYKQSGDSLEVYRTKLDGLTDNIKSLEKVQASLKKSLDNTDRSVDANAWDEGNRALAKYTKQLESYRAQRVKAQLQFDKFDNGVPQAKEELALQKRINSSTVTRLRAQEKAYSAQRAELLGSQTEQKKLNTLIEKQSAYVKKMQANKDGIYSDSAIKKEKVALEELQTEMIKVSSRSQKLFSSFGNISDKNINNLDKFHQKVTKLTSAESKLSKTSGVLSKVAESTQTALMGVGLGLAYGLKEAVAVEKEYVNIKNLAVTGGESVAESTKNVAQMQKDATKYSIQYGESQATIAEEYTDLIKRGHDTKQSLAVMKDELEASKASGDEFNEVVTISSQVLEAFGMKTNDTAKMTTRTHRVVNSLAYAADKTATNFHDIGKAMEYVGTTSKNAGFSLEETSAALGILSNNGLEADKAGTGLRKTLSSLTSPTSTQEAAMAALNLTTKDFVKSNGKMKSMSDVFALINKQLDAKGITGAAKADIFHRMFGATGQQAAQILADNTKGLKELTKQTKEATRNNYVHNLAEKNMKSTANQLKVLQQSSTLILQTMGQVLLPTVNKIAKGLQKTATWFNSLSDTTKEWGTYITVGATAIVALARPAAILIKAFQGTLKISEQVFAWAVKQNKSDMVRLATEEKITAEKRAQATLSEASVLSTGSASSTQTVSKVATSGEAAVLSSGARSVEKTAIKGVATNGSKLLARTALGSIGLSGALAATDLLGMTKKNKKEKLTTFFGNVSGSTIGGIIGTAIAPGIGTEIGVGLGGIAGSIIAKPLEKTFENWFKKHPVTAAGKLKLKVQQDKTAGKDLAKTVKADNAKILKEYKSHLNDLKKLRKQGILSEGQYNYAIAQEQVKYQVKLKGYNASESKSYQNKQAKLNKIFKQGTMSYQDYVKQSVALAKQYSTATKRYDNQSGAQQAKLAEAWRKKKLSINKKYNTLESKIYANQNISIDEKTKQINALEKKRAEALRQAKRKIALNTATDTASAYTKTYKTVQKGEANIHKLQQQMAKKNAQLSDQEKGTMVGKAKKQRDALIAVANNQYKRTYNLANKAKDKVIDSANEKYKKTVAYAKKEFSGNDEWSKRQRNNIINNAEKARDKAISKANDKFKKVTNRASKEAKKVSDYANKEYDSVKDNSNKSYKLAVQKANDKYKETVDKAKKEFTGSDKYARQMRQGIIDEAEKTRVQAIKKAKQKRDAVTKAAAQEANSTVKSTASGAKGIGAVVNWVITHIVNPIKKLFGGKVTKGNSNDISLPSAGVKATGSGYTYSGYASGGSIKRNETALVGEQGAELVYNPQKGGARLVGTNGATFEKLSAGEHVLNARDTAKVVSGQGMGGTLNGYAKGTSSLSDFFKFIKKSTKAITNIPKAIESMVSSPAKIVKKATSGLKSATNSSNTLVADMGNGVKGLLSDGIKSLLEKVGSSLGSGSSSAFLEKAISLGKGKPYVFGASGPDSYDCSGLVAAALKTFGIAYPHYTQSQYEKSEKIKQSEAKPGDLIFWGPNGHGHVGIYADSERMWDASSPSSHPQIGYHSWHTRMHGTGPMFARVPGLGKAGGLGTSGGGTVPNAKHRQLLDEADMPSTWYNDVNWIVNKESSWNYKATNASTGAYGLPQALPASKMAKAGSDWRTNPVTQLKWMKSYIKDIYGNASNAVAFHKRKGWYANGGLINTETEATLGENNRAEMVIPLHNTDRAFELMMRALNIMSPKAATSVGATSSTSTTTASDQKLDSLLDALNTMNTQMSQLLDVVSGIDYSDKRVYNKVTNYQQTQTRVNSIIRG